MLNNLVGIALRFRRWVLVDHLASDFASPSSPQALGYRRFHLRIRWRHPELHRLEPVFAADALQGKGASLTPGPVDLSRRQARARHAVSVPQGVVGGRWGTEPGCLVARYTGVLW